MGKTKRSKILRKEAIRTNPLGIPSVRSLELWEEETNGHKDSRSVYVQNIMEQMESRVAEERNTGLNALAAVTENEEIVGELLTTNVLNIAASLLLDDSVMVRHSAAGSLRNLSSVGANICEAMVSRGVMKSLVALLKHNYGIDWSPSKGKTLPDGTFKNDSATEAFVEALHLLSNLCSSSDDALRIFNVEKLLPTLPRILDVTKFGLPVALAGARCLHTVTEENRDSIPNIPELVSFLLTILNDSEDKGVDFIYLQTLVAGTICNLIGSKIDGQIIPLILQTLGRVLLYDVIKEINDFSSFVPLQEEGMDTGSNTNVLDSAKDLGIDEIRRLESTSSRITTLLDAQTLTMGILSNIVYVEDEDGGGSEEESDEGEPMEEDCVLTKLPLTATDFNVELSQAILYECIVSKIVSKTNSLPYNVTEILQNNSAFGKEILVKHCQLRTVGLMCLQNLLQALDLVTLGGVDQLTTIYITLTKILSSSNSTSPDKKVAHLDFVEAITSGLRAVLQKTIDERCDTILDHFSVDDLQALLSLKSLGTDNVRMATNLIRLIGSFGILISRRKVSSDSRLMMMKIGEFLLSSLSLGNETEEIIRTAEGLDTIFDVFAEDDFNDVLKELELIEKLRNLGPHFKKQARNKRRILGESRPVVETARANLSRFIEYKGNIIRS